MDISTPSLRTAGISLTAAAAIAFTPLVTPTEHHPAPLPQVSVAEVGLAVTSTDIGALAGVPVHALAGAVDNIVRAIDVGFTGLIDATGDPTGAAALTILKTLSVDAFAKLAENLRRGNTVIVSTATRVSDLVSSAVTGSARNVLTAAAAVAEDPLSPAAYTGLLTAGLESAALIGGNSLEVVRTLGGAAVELARIAVQEVTFQATNLVHGLGRLATELGPGTVVDESEADEDAVEIGMTELDAEDESPAPRKAAVERGTREDDSDDSVNRDSADNRDDTRADDRASVGIER